MRKEMIMLWDDLALNDYLTLNICFLCRWYLLQDRDQLDWIIADDQLNRSGTFPSNNPH